MSWPKSPQNFATAFSSSGTQTSSPDGCVKHGLILLPFGNRNPGPNMSSAEKVARKSSIVTTSKFPEPLLKSPRTLR